MIAKVAVLLPTNQTSETFDYNIPIHLSDWVKVGSRVVVPFGYQDVVGFVLDILKQSDFSGNIKDIIDILSIDAALTQEQMDLAVNLSEELNAPLGVTLDMMVPSFLKEKRKKYIHIHHSDCLNPALAMLFAGRKKVLLDQNLLSQYASIKKEEKAGHLSIAYDFSVYGTQKKIKKYRVIDKESYISQKRLHVIRFLERKREATLDEIIAHTTVSQALIHQMVKDKQLSFVEVMEVAAKDRLPNLKKKTTFDFDQQQIYEKFKESQDKPSLLFSNDDSFTLDFMAKNICDAANAGKATLIIAPSVMMVEEMAWQLKRLIEGVHIHTYHSRRSISDNFDCFHHIKQKEFTVCISTPMGIFLPLDHVGLIVALDEDHENYIHETFPHYNSLSVLKKRTKALSIPLLLTSPTPSVNSFYEALHVRYVLLEYLKPIQQKTSVIDMKESLLEEANPIISDVLKHHLKETLANQKMAMLIVNNKAYAKRIKCRSCGEVALCPTCNISLTYIDSKKIAKSHYCDYRVFFHQAC